MYSFYITNTTFKDVYVCLIPKAISSLNDSFHRVLEEQTDGNDESLCTSSSVNSYLVRWGFVIIPSNETIAFANDVDCYGPRQYVSLYACGKLWIMDFLVNCKMYGCLSVKSKIVDHGKGLLFYLNQANPQPLWTPGEKGNLFPSNIMEAGINAIQEGKFYFGRSIFQNGTYPCRVTANVIDSTNYLSTWYSVMDGAVQTSGELLQNTGNAEFIRAKTGDLVPPNAVIGGVTDPEGTLYLGRVGGNTPCAISTEKGCIKNFCFYSGEAKEVESGEIMVLRK